MFPNMLTSVDHRHINVPSTTCRVANLTRWHHDLAGPGHQQQFPTGPSVKQRPDFSNPKTDNGVDMYAPERQQAILGHARSAGRVDVNGLADLFEVTPETIRRD